MFSSLATVFLLISGSSKKMNFLSWVPISLLILYCLIGNAIFFGTTITGLEITELVFRFLSADIIYRTDLVMGLGGFAYGVGMINGYKQENYPEIHSLSPELPMFRAIQRLSWVAGLLCITILFAWMRFRHVGNAESVRLSIITAGFWPFIVAFFGWTLPFLGVYIGLKFAGYPGARKLQHRTVLAISFFALILSIVIGFRTYFILIIFVILAAYATCKPLKIRFLLLAGALSIAAFLIVTYVRVESGEGDGLLLAVFKRISLETIGAANIVFRLVDAQGFYLGKTLVMDLASKMPGRQETFGGMLGYEAGFEEGLTLTPSGILEIYANFGAGGYFLLFILGRFLGSQMIARPEATYVGTCKQILYFLFAIDFVMGGSAAFFDFLVRMFLLNIFTRIRL